MVEVNYNCIVCAEEFDNTDLKSIASSKVNTTKFKICQSCLDKSDPSEDYKQAKTIVNTYLYSTEIKSLFNEAKEIINNIVKK